MKGKVRSQSGDADERPAAIVVSLRRGLEILRAFQCADASLGNKDIAQRAKLPKATVARLTYTLTQMGYLLQSGSLGQYRPAEKVTALGKALLRAMPVRKAARPLMQALADRYNTSVALAVGEGSHMIYLEYCDGPDTVTTRLRVGALVPMAQTAIGRAYLWALEPARRERHLGLIEKGGESEIRQLRARLSRSFDELDRDGFTVSLGEWRPQIFAVGAPVYLDNGGTILALNCGVRRQDESEQTFRNKLGPALVAASADITNAMNRLGYNFWDE